MSSSKRIAKNTLLLYFRMFLIMGVSLYTSRVVLQELGVSDFGIYSLVGGIVSMLGFFNAAMSSATQRYLSFDIGKGNEVQLQKTFSATLTIHFFIALLALILAETLGLWYINYKMVFNEDRLFAVNVVYQFSILTFLLNIIQVPYNALIIARERMNIYAYVSILEVSLKLGIVFLLIYGKDKLIMYSMLTFIVALIIRLIYQFYCKKQFKESKYKFAYDKVYFLELLAYSGWSLFGNFAIVARGQGVNMVLNLFFGTIVNAAYGITMQVQGAVQMFVSNFQMAVNPQIIKLYAQNEREKMFTLVCLSSKFSFLLILLIISPLIFNIDFFLGLWLGYVPEYVSLFCQVSLLCVLVDSLSGSLMVATQATGKIKVYQIIVGTILFLNLPISYLLLKNGNLEGYVVFIVMLILSIIALFFRLFFLKKIIDFNVSNYIKTTIMPCLLIASLNALIFFNIRVFFKQTLLDIFLSIFICSVLSILIIYILGTSRNDKKKIKEILIKYIAILR